jgi:hypothetical protein
VRAIGHWAILALLASAGCATRLPAPAATVPTNLGRVPPPHQGMGILVVDVVDGPTEVGLFHADAIRCTSPCWFELPPGEHMLNFKYEDARHGIEYDGSTATVTAGSQVLRRALRRSEIVKPVRQKLALGLWVSGNVAMLAGTLALLFPQERGSDVARGLGLGGLGAFVLSIPLGVGTIKRYRGAQVQFPLPPAR